MGGGGGTGVSPVRTGETPVPPPRFHGSPRRGERQWTTKRCSYGLTPRNCGPTDAGRLLEAAARPDRAADADRLGMAGDLVREDFDVVQDALELRHHVRDLAGHVVEVVVQRWVGDDPLEGAVLAVDDLH